MRTVSLNKPGVHKAGRLNPTPREQARSKVYELRPINQSTGTCKHEFGDRSGRGIDGSCVGVGLWIQSFVVVVCLPCVVFG